MQPFTPDRFLDALLEPWRAMLGPDYYGYRNHCQRMMAFCLALHPCSDEERQKIAIAAVFHDIGIWVANTVDYIPPSLLPAMEYLDAQGLSAWHEEIALMIGEHHKLRAYGAMQSSLVERFRRADLVDFSLGLVRFGLSRAQIRAVRAALPNAGFHAMLVRRASAWFVRHPLNPAPMMKW